MGITKTEGFTEGQVQLAYQLKALAHPARIAIVQYLLQQKTCICGDLVLELPLAQATISQHLNELKKVHIIQGNVEGNSICYCLNPNTFEVIQSFFTKALKLISQNNTCC